MQLRTATIVMIHVFDVTIHLNGSLQLQNQFDWMSHYLQSLVQLTKQLLLYLLVIDMGNLNGDMVGGACHVLIVVIDDGETSSQGKQNVEYVEIVGDAAMRYLYLMKRFEFLNLYTVVREIISLDNAKLKLYNQNDNTVCVVCLMELNYLLQS